MIIQIVMVHPPDQFTNLEEQLLLIGIMRILEELEKALEAAENLLAPDGVLAIVSFHSLEDRIVKNFLNAKSGKLPAPSRHRPDIRAEQPAIYALTPRKPLLPSDAEIAVNVRARSAKLRVARRLADVAGKTNPLDESA